MSHNKMRIISTLSYIDKWLLKLNFIDERNISLLLKLCIFKEQGRQLIYFEIGKDFKHRYC